MFDSLKNQNPEWVYYFTYNLYMNPEDFSQIGLVYELHGPALLNGYTLSFNVLEDEFFRFERRGVANIVPQRGHCVEGVLYKISGEELATLDHYIGVNDFKYYRKQVWVKNGDSNKKEAYTHVGWPDKTANKLLPSERYLKRLVNAASRVPTSERFREWLCSHPTTF